MSLADEGPYFPWRHAARRPGETLRAMLDEDPSRWRALLLAIPVPLAWVLVDASNELNPGSLLVAAVIALTVNVAPTLAHALVVTKVSRWYGSRGRFEEVLAGYAWAQPLVALIVLLLGLQLDRTAAPPDTVLLLAFLALSIAAVPFLAVALRVSNPRAAFIEGVARSLEVGFIAGLMGAAWLLKESRGGELGLLVLLAAGVAVLLILLRRRAP